MVPDVELENDNEDLEEDYVETSNTCKINFVENIFFGSVDGIDALKQAIFIIMHTERYAYLIHSWDFGIELADLIGEDMDYVEVELESRIIEALEADDRIDSVDDFEFERSGRKLTVSFVVNSNLGIFTYEDEMEV